jgi:hypothetical protein
MKSNKQSPIYFSAYPLKAVHISPSTKTSEESPYLKAVLSGKTRSFSRVRVMPMQNPCKAFAVVKSTRAELPQSEDTGINEPGWYNNYE